MHQWIISLFTLVLCIHAHASDNLSSLNEHGFKNWNPKVFSGETIYNIREYKGRLALQAISQSSASGLILEQKIDLAVTPYINWSWLTETKLQGLDERNKSGDDFVARVYIVIDGGFRVWKSQSLTYVWSSNQDTNLVWDNPFAKSNVKMISIQGQESKTGHWYDEKRNIFEDLISTFGDKGSEEANLNAYQYIDAVAIMTDTDNSEKKAESYYGDIIFSEM